MLVTHDVLYAMRGKRLICQLITNPKMTSRRIGSTKLEVVSQLMEGSMVVSICQELSVRPVVFRVYMVYFFRLLADFYLFVANFWPFWDQDKSGEKSDQYIGGMSFISNRNLRKMVENSHFQPCKFTSNQNWRKMVENSQFQPCKFTSKIHHGLFNRLSLCCTTPLIQNCLPNPNCHLRPWIEQYLYKHWHCMIHWMTLIINLLHVPYCP